MNYHEYESLLLSANPDNLQEVVIKVKEAIKSDLENMENLVNSLATARETNQKLMLMQTSERIDLNDEPEIEPTPEELIEDLEKDIKSFMY